MPQGWEYRRVDWILCPWGGENSRHCFSLKGRGIANFVKLRMVTTGIYIAKLGFIKGETLRLLRTNDN